MDISIQCKVDLFHRLLDKTYMLTRSSGGKGVKYDDENGWGNVG